jgi:CO/xanthine dehydrogenase Mo-binding subunit
MEERVFTWNWRATREQEQITFTRGRPRKSNDQCYGEQKHGQIVRQVVGYDRFTGELARPSTHGTLPGAAGVGQLLIAPR